MLNLSYDLSFTAISQLVYILNDILDSISVNRKWNEWNFIYPLISALNFVGSSKILLFKFADIIVIELLFQVIMYADLLHGNCNAAYFTNFLTSSGKLKRYLWFEHIMWWFFATLRVKGGSA